MNMIFLVDGDNNIGTGLQGIDLLTADDTVLVFYGKGQSLSSVQKLCAGTKAQVQYLESVRGGKNSIDFQIITELGVLVGRGEADFAYVISQDKGYEAAMGALRARYAGTSMLQYHLDTRQVLPGTVAEFLQADPRPVEELFFLTGSPQEKAALRDLLTGIQGIGFADPFPNDLEVIAGDIDKGEALRFLLRHLGLEASQVLAMGDGGSDLPLLQAAGIGVAMANATEGVKAAADFVTTSCDEDGVAVALEKFVL